ncbi:MAG: glutathione S-transferase family protein [Rhodobiaceae bacterium]|nr:glutathione S-transferase family protein [Rhodobiaceae bacterium]
MSDGLVLYTNPQSRGRIVRWMLEELGQPYRTEVVGYGPPMKSPEYLAINPMGKVPAIKHGDTVVTECAAICTYLADAFPDAGLMPPAGSPARGEFFRWMFFAAGPLEQAVVNTSFGFEVPVDGQGRAGYGTYDLVMDTLDAHFKTRDFALGDAFSAVDVYLGSHIMFGMMFGGVEKRPSFEAYCGRLTARPALRKASEIDDKLAEEAKSGG